jgi:hypothetical protein
MASNKTNQYNDPGKHSWTQYSDDEKGSERTTVEGSKGEPLILCGTATSFRNATNEIHKAGDDVDLVIDSTSYRSTSERSLAGVVDTIGELMMRMEESDLEAEYTRGGRKADTRLGRRRACLSNIDTSQSDRWASLHGRDLGLSLPRRSAGSLEQNLLGKVPARLRRNSIPVDRRAMTSQTIAPSVQVAPNERSLTIAGKYRSSFSTGVPRSKHLSSIHTNEFSDLTLPNQWHPQITRKVPIIETVIPEELEWHEGDTRPESNP